MSSLLDDALAMNEKPANRRDRRPCLTEIVRGACRYQRLMHYHTHDSRHSQKGFPDFVIVTAPLSEISGSATIYAELKKQKTRPSPEQVEWLDALSLDGYRCFLWRPMHWLDGTISWILGDVWERKRRDHMSPIHAGSESGLWTPGVGVTGDKFSTVVGSKARRGGNENPLGQLDDPKRKRRIK